MLPGRSLGHDLSSLSLGQPAKSRDASFGNGTFNLGLGGLSGICSVSNCSLDESGLANPKVPSGTRAVDLSLASLSTSASFYGSGISDLRAAVVAQQKQVDGLVDKVAVLFSAMRTEVLQDVRSASQHGFGEVQARLAGLHRAEAEVDSRLAELRQSEEGLREWLQSELKVLHDQVRGEVQDRIVDCFGDDLRGMTNRLAHLEEDVKFVSEAPGWEAALERIKLQVHDELQNVREEMHESVETALLTKLRMLEERVVDVERSSLSPAIGVELATHRNHLEKLEMVVQRGQVGMQNLGKACDQLQSQVADWRPWVEKRIESLTQQTSLNDVKARIDNLEQFRHRSEENFRGQSPLRDRLGSLEERLDSLRDDMKSVTSSIKRARQGDNEGAVALEAMKDRIDAVAASSQQDTQRLQQRLNDVMRLGIRVDNTEAGLEAMQRQLLQQRGEQWSLALKPQQPDSLTEVRLSQVQGYAQRLTEELRTDIESRFNQLQSQTQKLVDEVRSDLEAQRSQVQSFPREFAEEMQQEIESGVAEAHAATRRLVEGLQNDLEPRVGQIQSASQRLADELRQDFEARFSQLQSSSKRSQDELRQELETRCAQLRSSTEGVTDELGDLQQELEAQVMQCQEFLRQELEVRLSDTLGSTKKAIDEWRLEVEARIAETTTVATRMNDQIGEVSEGLESRLDTRIEARMSQTHSFAQRLMNELRQEIDAQLQQMHSVSKQLAQHINQNSKDTQLIGNGLEAMQEILEQTHQHGNPTRNQAHSDAIDARIAQVRGAVERLADEFNETSGGMRTDIGKIRLDISKDLDALKRNLTDVQQSVIELQGEKDTVTLSVAETAREAAGEAVAMLGKTWQQELQGSLIRCDEGSSKCERCVEAALAKVGAMEGQLRSIADDLRSQLAQEGGSLIEALGSSVRLDGSRSPDPALAASIAAREMLTGHSPCRVRREPAIGDSWSSPQVGRPPRSQRRPSLTLEERISSQDQASSVAMARNVGYTNASVDERLQEHDQAVQDLREMHLALQGEVEGFLLERRVTRSLAGLERRGRSPQSLAFAQCGGRRACSLDSIRLL